MAGVFSNGSISLCGKYIGRDQPGKVNEVFTIAVICAGAAALIAQLPALFSRKPPPDSWERKEKSCLWPPLISGGWEREPLPIIISQVLMAFTKTDGSPRLGLYSIIVMTVINITLGFCNVLFFHLGMFGMAMATSISYFAAVFICLIHFSSPSILFVLSG